MELHQGHRERVRKRFIQQGVDHMEKHELLELLLFYSIPRSDTNALAHRLIERFGSFSNVMHASVEELMSVPGMGESSAVFLNLVASVNRICVLEGLPQNERFDTIGKIGSYLQKLYADATTEQVYMLSFDNSMRLIDRYLAAEGSVNCTQVQIRSLTERAILKHACCVVFAHNHPGGIALPSQADRDLSSQIGAVFDILEIPLLEHIIVAENGFAPILRHSRGVLRASPMTCEVDERFYRAFYEEEQDPKDAGKNNVPHG